MTRKKPPGKEINWQQISAFRLSRHHLIDGSRADFLSVCGNVCGIQAQLMAAAEMALWARIHCLSRNEISSALWEKRSLVRTSCMRQTLHLIPATELFLFLRALERSRFEALMRIMSRFGITPGEVDGLNEAILEALDAGPLPQRELRERIRPRVAKNVREWMARVWSPLRPAIVRGLICYGPNRSQEATFVRLDRWLPNRQNIDEMEAKQILLRRYLGAYGPATLQDFCRWSGIPAGEAAPVWASLAGELVDICIEDQKRSILREDRRELADSGFAEPVLRLLPGFDPYMLGHAAKSHLVDDRHYKRVYRNQWWISPVVLLNGRVIGTWSYTRRSKGLLLGIGLFEKIPKVIDALIETEATSLSAFLEMPVELKLRSSAIHV